MLLFSKNRTFLNYNTYSRTILVLKKIYINRGLRKCGLRILKNRAKWPNNIAHVAILSMAEQLVDRLINPVDNLREKTRRQNANASGSQVSRANRQSSQST